MTSHLVPIGIKNTGSGTAKSVNKFGSSVNMDSGSQTDVWDGADNPGNQKIWLAPTASRIHNISSTDATDTIAGTGCRQVKIYGLEEWDSAEETSETVDMDGLTLVPTVNSYVIIHRAKSAQWGDTIVNAGDISITAQVDDTDTAFIRAGKGQTSMAIYGISASSVFYMCNYYASASKSASSFSVSIRLLVNTNPQNISHTYVEKHTIGLTTEGISAWSQTFDPNMKIKGPAIIKLQGISTTANAAVSGGFNGWVVT